MDTHTMHKPQPATVLGIRAVALLELVIFLVIALLIDTAFLDGTRYFNTNPHPFWIIVVLLSVQYGFGSGFAAVIACSILLLIGNMPEQQSSQDSYAYLLHIAANPLMWLVGATIIGEIRQRHIRERDRLYQELEIATEREQKITDSYEKVRELKERLELRIASQVHSATNAYRAAQSIERLHPQEVLHGIMDLVKSVLGPEKFSVFLLSGTRLESRLVSGWQDMDAFPTEYTAQTNLFQSIIGNQSTLSVVNEEHERILAGQGVLATAIIDKNSGEVLGMLKVERMEFTDLNLQTVETFKAIAEWVGMAIINARHYQVALDDTVVNPEHNLMTTSYFNRFNDYIHALAKRLNFNVALLAISMNNVESLDPETRNKVSRILSQAVDSVLRSVDLAFDRQQSNGQYSIILPNSNVEGARKVQKKIEQVLLPEVRKLSSQVSFNFNLQALFEATK